MRADGTQRLHSRLCLAQTQPGLPAFNPNDVLDKSLGEACVALAKKWKEEGGASASAQDIAQFKAKQTMYFLDQLTLLGTLAPV